MRDKITTAQRQWQQLQDRLRREQEAKDLVEILFIMSEKVK